jgi:glycine cleavage system T protein (aminomethyltransferase)
MVDFAGWDMPVQYPTGILAEHQAVRTKCGIFDLSHMGRVYVRGADAMALAQQCCTRDFARIPPGEAAYSVLCQEDGGIVDDVIAYKLGDTEVLFVFNASNRLVDIEFFTKARDRLGLKAELADHTLESALIGVQGPTAQAVLQPLCSEDLEPLAGYAFAVMDVCDVPAIVARTGYTGEDGFEVMVDAAAAESVWSALARQATPCGLGARDTLRTEAGFALYGHEIDRSTNPYEARLGWVVSLSKPRFVGRDALQRLKAEGPKRRLVGLLAAPGAVPRAGTSILDSSQPVGHVTSGTFSPTLRQNVALGYVPLEMSEVGHHLDLELRGRPAGAEVVALPFVPHRSRPRAKM